MKFRIPHSAFRILSAFWRLNVAEELQYRANFIASVLGTLFNMATALLTLSLFFHHTTSLGGWDYWESVVLISLAFWFVSVENIAVLFDAVYEGARYPVSAYPGPLRFLFVYLIPIAWTTTIPASALTGRLRPAIGLAAAAVAGVAFVLARALWRAAL